MLNNDNVISSKDLTYEPYRQSRGEDGFSGQLFLAAEVKNPETRYIIKAGVAHVAACEFMFYKLASKLGLRVARVRLVAPAKPDEFEYPACAVDFIPNAVMLTYDDFMRIEECEILMYLSFILGDNDNLDFLRDENGDIYKIDHSDCFGIEGIAETWINPNQIALIYGIYQIAKPMPRVGYYAEMEILWDMLKKIANLSITDFNDDLDLIKKYCGKPFDTHFRYYINELIEQCKNALK